MLGGLLKIYVANTFNVYSVSEKGYDMIWIAISCWINSKKPLFEHALLQFCS